MTEPIPPKFIRLLRNYSTTCHSTSPNQYDINVAYERLHEWTKKHDKSNPQSALSECIPPKYIIQSKPQSSYSTPKREPTLKRKKYVDIIEYANIGMTGGVVHEIKSGCDVNEQDINGRFAVAVACERNDTHMVKILVEAGARLDVISPNGVTPLAYAIYNHNQELVDYIHNHLNKTK